MEHEPTSLFEEDENPLLSDSSADWDRLIEAVGPASILVAIEMRMSAALKKRLSPEDIWQETLLYAWRDRTKCEWRGLKSFRSWLLTVMDRRIRDAAAHEAAAKRGGGQSPVPFSTLEQTESRGTQDSPFPGPVGSTTPSRIAIHREQAAAMRVALELLPVEFRDVVRMRLFEQLKVEEIATRLSIGASAVRHRFRKGARMYQHGLMRELATRSLSISRETMTVLGEESSPNEG
jgi:RNA polymerase sigma factor (sigma-70 family)